MALFLPTANAVAGAGVCFTARAIPMAIKKTDDSFSCVRSCIRARLHLPVLSLHSARRPLSLSYAALSDENYEEDSSDYDDAGRLFIGNIPFTITTSELARIFSQAGTVNSVEIIPDRFTNRNRGFGFISMATVEDANKAIRMFDGAKIGDRIVKVNFPEVPRTSRLDTLDPFKDTGTPGYIDKGCKLYAGNLRWTVTSEILAEAFSSCSGVLGAKVIYEPLALRSRGFGFVAFASAEESQAALDSMNGKRLVGRPLRLSHANWSRWPTQTSTEEQPPLLTWEKNPF